jgi:quercetin dioxygenase-like cupin family protein
MQSESSYSREGYLHENFRYFHLRDNAGQERDYHFHEFDKIVVLISGSVTYMVEARPARCSRGTWCW